ncbi:hypothetical protein O181_106892 [Austropuccinia psidii MF-1]|uniref:Uncharacterized protein n=1 Tax=Austropuccinia psidii MF-1 TaxID=1389203 RepID=A0A9Q3JR89_9BASI|nr:hypothetical protein [Austropuccinia psidii MF-1]
MLRERTKLRRRVKCGSRDKKSNKSEEESKNKEPETQFSEELPSETQTEININNANRELKDMGLSGGGIEEKIKRNKKREATNVKLNIYDLEGKELSEKALTEIILAENHHFVIDHSFTDFSITYIRLGYETIPIIVILN